MGTHLQMAHSRAALTATCSGVVILEGALANYVPDFGRDCGGGRTVSSPSSLDSPEY
jgi:hypothetical protein